MFIKLEEVRNWKLKDFIYYCVASIICFYIWTNGLNAEFYHGVIGMENYLVLGWIFFDWIFDELVIFHLSVISYFFIQKNVNFYKISH